MIFPSRKRGSYVITVQAKCVHGLLSEVCSVVDSLGLHGQCQLVYHKWCWVWWNWWNIKSYAACCCSGDSEHGAVNIPYGTCYALMKVKVMSICIVSVHETSLD